MRRPLTACKRSSSYCQKDRTHHAADQTKATAWLIPCARKLVTTILFMGNVFHATEEQPHFAPLLKKSIPEATKPVTITITNAPINEVLQVNIESQHEKVKGTDSTMTIINLTVHYGQHANHKEGGNGKAAAK